MILSRGAHMTGWSRTGSRVTQYYLILSSGARHYTAHHKHTNKTDNDDSIPTGLRMDKQKSNTDNNIIITAIIIIESSIVLYIRCDSNSLRGEGVRSTRIDWRRSIDAGGKIDRRCHRCRHCCSFDFCGNNFSHLKNWNASWTLNQGQGGNFPSVKL